MSGPGREDADSQGRGAHPSQRKDSRTEVIEKVRAAERAAPARITTTTRQRERELMVIRERHPGTTTHAQQQRILEAAADGVTVVEARRFLLISNPSDCVGRLPEEVKSAIKREPVVWRDEMGALRETVLYVLVH
ncbi:hypothetical protein [Azohydromonas sp.]|uniref:hypothetical protein n=1 Tax=Azohydromonas sp. TaxID=1872666 RepID=UPI002C1DEB7E|nr:hypothetical protein [Azohydromonas sp.]HMM85782.1 hypothetical protein [Azohydromonas sp.]